MELHRSLCRICTKKLGRVSYSTQTPAEKGNTKTMIEQCFECTGNENPDIYPSQFCNSCYLTMRRMMKAQVDGSVYRTSLALHSWVEHTSENCVTCGIVEARRSGGRPKTKPNVKLPFRVHSLCCWTKIQLFHPPHY